MHEVSLGGTLTDYLTGEARERTTYEDLRQALAQFLVEERGFSPERLKPRFKITYRAGAEEKSREADIAMFSPDDALCLLVVFCPGQIHTYQREVAALARLAKPEACPLAVVTDLREAELFSVVDLSILAKGLGALPAQDEVFRLAEAHRPKPLSAEQEEKESRILHAYTGFLKTCCGAVCLLPEK